VRRRLGSRRRGVRERCHAELASSWRRGTRRAARPLRWRSVEHGAATSIWAAVAPELAGVGGLYLDDCTVAEPWTADEVPPTGHYLPYLLDPEHAERLWKLSEQLVEGVGR
jgi:hypothetical protein